jgi:hypothetical protein
MINSFIKYSCGSFPKDCRSCKSTYDKTTWGQLALVGYFINKRDGLHGLLLPDLEYRNCGCGSTLTVRIIEEG